MSGLLRDRVYKAIRRAIITCELLPGDELREHTLAEKYRVSRSPIRDALLRLEQEHLVTVMPRQGYQIRPLHQADLDDLFDFRMVIAPACAAAAAKADEAAVQQLDQFRDGPSSAGLVKDVTDYDFAFHRAVADLAGNDRLSSIERGLIDEFQRVMAIAYKSQGAQLVAEVVAEHVSVIEAIQAHSSVDAYRTMAHHIEEARRRITASYLPKPSKPR